MIKVVHLQHSTASAGSAAYRLHKAFLNANIESSILSLYSHINGNKAINQLGKKVKINFEIK